MRHRDEFRPNGLRAEITIPNTRHGRKRKVEWVDEFCEAKLFWFHHTIQQPVYESNENYADGYDHFYYICILKMVLGNLIQINAQGNEERLLYGNPQTTYFKDVYKRCTNFAINYSKVPFTSAAEGDFFGKKIHITIPKRGDLLAGLYLNLSFDEIKRTNKYQIMHDDIVKSSTFDPQFTSYVNGIGYNCIEYINFYINRSLVQTLNGELIYTRLLVYIPIGDRYIFFSI